MIKILVTELRGQSIEELRIRNNNLITKNLSKKQKREIIDCLNESDKQRKGFMIFLTGRKIKHHLFVDGVLFTRAHSAYLKDIGFMSLDFRLPFNRGSLRL